MSKLAHGVEHQCALGIGMQQHRVEVVAVAADDFAHGFFEIALGQKALRVHRLIHLLALGCGERTQLLFARTGHAHIGQLHCPAKRKKLRRVPRGDFATRNGARADDAIVKARHELPKKQTTEIPLGQLEARHGHDLPRGVIPRVVADEAADDVGIKLVQLARVRLQHALHFTAHHVAIERSVLALEPILRRHRRRAFFAQRINPAHRANRFRHRFGSVFLHQCVGVLHFLGIHRIFTLHAAPAPVAIVAAIVRVPAQHIPQLRPRKRLAAPQHPRRQHPRPSTAGHIQFRLSQHAQVPQQNFQARNPLARAADVPTLPPKGAAVTRKTIIRAKDHRATAEHLRISGSIEHRPADGAMADVEGEVEVGVGVV